MIVHGREVVLKTLAGSSNRNLNDDNSDRDIKLFVLPSFEDMYTSAVYKNFTTSETEDVEIHDVRKLEKLLYNSNLTYLELLYSVEIDAFGFEEIENILHLRDRIAKMNLKSLFNSCFGMYKGQMKDLKNPNSELQKQIIKQYGYNPKKAMMSLHFLKFISKFYETDFTDFQKAIWYEGEEKEYMLDVKRGKYNLYEITQITLEEEEKAKALEQVYFDYPVDEETNNRIKEELRSLVKKQLANQI